MWWLPVPDKRVRFHDPRFNLTGEIQPKDVGGGICGRFSNFNKLRPEVAGDVISNFAVDSTNLDVLVKFGDSTLNSSRIIGLCCLMHFSSDIISGNFGMPIVPDKYVKFCDPCLNCPREIPHLKPSQMEFLTVLGGGNNF